jgi:PmbA protein
LIEGVSRGLLLQEVMGMHTADPVSGDFSVGAQGRWIEGGKLTRGVRGVTLAGNLKALLNGIEAVGDDLTWYGSTGTPTFRVAQLTIGGT